MQSQPARFGYILKRFPRLSETFVLNEILELERQGADIQPFSLHLPDDGRFHGDLARLRNPIDFTAAEKSDLIWSRLLESGGPNTEGWDDCIDFSRRHGLRKSLDLMMSASWIAQEVRHQGIQHLHAHFATVSTQVACLVSRMTGVPYSFTAHAKDIFRDDVDEALLTELGQRAAFVITVSDYNRDYILSRYPEIPPHKVHRLYNGIDLTTLQIGSQAEKTRAGAPASILSVGRLVPKKGFHHLLRALARCRDDGIAFRATIVGEGPERQALATLAHQLGLDGQIRFTGALSHEAVRDLGAQANCAVLAAVPDETGNADALPTVLLEALAQGVPIVSTRLTGIPEIVGEEGGMLVDPGDEAGLAQAIAEVLRRSAAGLYPPATLRARAEDRFDLVRNAGTLLKKMTAVETVSAAR